MKGRTDAWTARGQEGREEASGGGTEEEGMEQLRAMEEGGR